MTQLVQLREAAFEVTILAQIVVSAEGVLVLANQAARLLFNLAFSDLGRLLQDLPLSSYPLALQAYIEQTYRDRDSVLVSNVERLLAGGVVQFLDVQFTPLQAQDQEWLGCSIAFQDVTHYAQLQRDLQLVNQELVTTNEELQSTQEELAATNEELQVTNEELATTNEELQATNEELETINEELQARNKELEARIKKSRDSA